MQIVFGHRDSGWSINTLGLIHIWGCVRKRSLALGLLIASLMVVPELGGGGGCQVCSLALSERSQSSVSDNLLELAGVNRNAHFSSRVPSVCCTRTNLHHAPSHAAIVILLRMVMWSQKFSVLRAFWVRETSLFWTRKDWSKSENSDSLAFWSFRYLSFM